MKASSKAFPTSRFLITCSMQKLEARRPKHYGYYILPSTPFMHGGLGSYITSFAFCFLHLNCRILIKSEYDMLERGRLTRLERLCSIRFTCTTMFTNFAVLWLANTPDKYTSSIHIPLHSILYIKRQIHVCPGRIQANIKLQANPLTSTKIHHYIL